MAKKDKKCADCDNIIWSDHTRCKRCVQLGKPKTKEAIEKFAAKRRGLKFNKTWCENMSKVRKGIRKKDSKNRLILGDKYVFVYAPNHPNKVCKWWILEHRFVMEQHLGRYLTENEVVHHIDHDASNNNIENLQLLTKTEHSKLHVRGQFYKKQILKIIQQEQQAIEQGRF